jgi:prolyl oligopeptidase PreP (S9A serine peptidase family)
MNKPRKLSGGMELTPEPEQQLEQFEGVGPTIVVHMLHHEEHRLELNFQSNHKQEDALHALNSNH